MNKWRHLTTLYLLVYTYSMDKRKALHEWIDRMPRENLWAFMAFMKRMEAGEGNTFFGYFSFVCKASTIYSCESKHLLREDD